MKAQQYGYTSLLPKDLLRICSVEEEEEEKKKQLRCREMNKRYIQLSEAFEDG